MQPAARLQAAIEILDGVIAAARDGGAPADRVIARELSARRYAGAADRRAIRELVWEAIRALGERPQSGRAAFLGLAETQALPWLALFDGSPHGPAPPVCCEPRARPAPAPDWLVEAMDVPEADRPALVRALGERAPLDLRVNRRAAEAPFLEAPVLEPLVSEARPLALADVGALPLGWRLATPRPIGTWLEQGLAEVQDAGSQAVAHLVAPRQGERIVDLCAGAGGKTLALAHHPGAGRRLCVVAADTDRGRLARLAPRAERSGVAGDIETRLLDPGREEAGLGDLLGLADAVLVDAPCSGSGTWRRQPELRWRLTPERLEQLTALQARLLALGARLVRPGGRLVYAVCSLVRAEGAAQADAFAAASGWTETRRLLLRPDIHGCDGFFIACYERRC